MTVLQKIRIFRIQLANNTSRHSRKNFYFINCILCLATSVHRDLIYHVNIGIVTAPSMSKLCTIMKNKCLCILKKIFYDFRSLPAIFSLRTPSMNYSESYFPPLELDWEFAVFWWKGFNDSGSSCRPCFH